MSQKTITITTQGNQIQVTIPQNIYPIIHAKLRFQQTSPNILLSDVCYVCGVNANRLNKEETEWIKSNICIQCDKKTPYIPVSVTEVVNFDECQASWYFSNVLNLPIVVSTQMLEGTISHACDNILVNLMNDKQFFEKLKEKYPSRFDMYREVNKKLNEEYDVIIKDALEETNFMQGYVPEKLLLTLKRDIFDKLLDDFTYLTVMRIYNDILFEGDYRKLISRRWEEKRVFGHFEHNGIKFLIRGRIDKLYRLGNEKFLIRDDKSLRVIRLPGRGQSLYSYSTQLGGYHYCLSQMFTPKVETVGIIWLIRFADIVPAECDKDKFVSIAKEMCNLIAEGKAPTRCIPKVGLCSPNYCSYWNTCWGLEGK